MRQLTGLMFAAVGLGVLWDLMPCPGHSFQGLVLIGIATLLWKE